VLVPASLAALALSALSFGLEIAMVDFWGTPLANLASRNAPASVVAAALVGLSLCVAVFAGAFVFGSYLAALTLLGQENTQAFTALDHPGFKHFVRLRVRGDGSAVDGWCLGLVDPLGEGEQPLLVDSFTWKGR